MTVYADAPAHSRGPGPLPNRRRGTIRPRVSTRESLRFLTDVGNTLAASLDYPSTLQKAAELMVPRLACYCELDLIEDGRVQCMGLAHRDSAQIEIGNRAPAFAVQEVCAGLLADVLSSGRSLLFADTAPGLSRSTGCHPESIAQLSETGATSLLLVPLIARGRPLGVLLLASTRVDRSYGQQDLALAEEVARIAALAIDNARLYCEANRAIQAREDILRVVSHDLRNPIGAVTSAASVVLESSASELTYGSTQRLLRTIVRAARQASRMIDDLLDLGRIDFGRLAVDLKPEVLGELLTEALELHAPIARERSIQLLCVAHGPSPTVLVDHGRILQLLGNLLANAIRFTPAEGRIEIAVSVEGQEARCSVRDTGPGIPPDQLPHVFDRFWQATRGDRGGLGLGLAIVRAIAEAHGGRVWVESELGKGTSVVFTLRLAEAAHSMDVQ